MKTRSDLKREFVFYLVFCLEPVNALSLDRDWLAPSKGEIWVGAGTPVLAACE